MRILAIRGCNLASLAGEFEVDLARAPLGGAGVFAIVGNTGAGKSTLLDAMCAALFDRTPRLGAPSRVQVGRGPEDPLALGATDVRTLLRRGAAAGWAEVDFESGDARRYRARWAVRRARGHSDGALQDQQLSLVALDGAERLGGTKTETLKSIQQRLGLTFDQFRRSALLAQGEFAAFLRADGKDRSELLERMTGTEIYSRLSIAAHLRAARAELELRDRRGAAMAIAVLDDDARLAKAGELDAARAARVVARDALVRGEAAARWQTEAARREAAAAEARAAGAAARAAMDAAAGDRDELALRRRAEALRPAWDAAARVDRELAAARLACDAAVAAAGAARTALDGAFARRVAIAGGHAPIRAARVAAGLVERAARTGGKPPAAELLIADVADDAAWLARHAALAPQVAAWPALEAKLGQHAAARAAIAGIDRELAARAAADGTLRAARDAASREHAEAAGRLEAAQRRAAGLRERGGGPSLDAARRAEDAARTRRGEVAVLATIAAAARERAAARAAIGDQLAALDAAVAADRAAVAVATTARDAARGAAAELDRTVASLRTIAGYGHARTELVAGEPCPLCGAVDHPWRDRGALDAAIGDAEARLAAARGRDTAATGELAAIAARDAHRAGERAGLIDRAAALDAARAGHAAAWRDQLAAVAELALVDDPDAPAAAGFAAERAAAADAACELARAERARVEAGLKAAADAHQESLARQADVSHVVARLASIDDDRRALAAVVERHAGERAARLGHAAELAAAIAAELAGWRDVAGPVPDVPGPVSDVPGVAAPAAAIPGIVAAWRRAADRVAAADAELAAADAELGRAVAAAERAVAEADARAAAALARRDAVAAERVTAAAALAAATADAALAPDALARLLAAPAGAVDALAARLDALARTDALAAAVAAERARDVADHAASRPADLALVGELAALDRAAADADALVARLVAELAADADARGRRAAALAALADATAGYEVDRVLGDVIGSHDGKLFRSFAQSLTLDALLAVANAHLDELAPRYRLERVPRHDLELQVVDRELGDELRSVQSLSGGESFLVSLALALGLSAMSAHDVRVRTLLIDEGFGTLDPATLDTALAVLDRLQATGRQIGVISHVPALVERVGAHVRVIQRGNGRSEVVVDG